MFSVFKTKDQASKTVDVLKEKIPLLKDWSVEIEFDTKKRGWMFLLEHHSLNYAIINHSDGWQNGLLWIVNWEDEFYFDDLNDFVVYIENLFSTEFDWMEEGF